MTHEIKVQDMSTGNQKLAMLSALANPHRMRIVAYLYTAKRSYISQMARDVGLSRPLLHLHLQKLQKAGLVTGQLEVSPDGKALNFITLTDFSVLLTAETVAEIATSLTDSSLTKD